MLETLGHRGYQLLRHSCADGVGFGALAAAFLREGWPKTAVLQHFSRCHGKGGAYGKDEGP